MSQSVATLSPPPVTETHPGRSGLGRSGRSIALAVILACQMMVVLDATVVNVALPKISTGLHFSTANLSWVINAYALTFGGLLLLGGRAGDLLGRRRVFIGGIALFTVASLLGGLATGSVALLAARAVQGIGAALASPTALSLISTNFREGAERTRAMSLYAAVSAAGGSIGLIVGGALTSWVSWRWAFFVNVPIGIAVVLLARRHLAESDRQSGHFDLRGALTSTLGMSALVYGFVRAGSHGWGDTWTVTAFVASVALLVAFVIGEFRAEHPITPLHLFADRLRTSAYLIRLPLVAGMFGMFFYLTQFVQDVLGFSALTTGLAFLPMTVSIFMSARLAPRLLPRFGPVPITVVGIAMATIGMGWLSRVSDSSHYATGILPALVLFGLGMGMPFVALTVLGMARVAPQDTGAASGLLNVTQQVGGALGLSILVTVFGTASHHAARHPLQGASPKAEAVHVLANSVGTTFAVATLFIGLALIAAISAVRRPAAVAR